MSEEKSLGIGAINSAMTRDQIFDRECRKAAVVLALAVGESAQKMEEAARRFKNDLVDDISKQLLDKINLDFKLTKNNKEKGGNKRRRRHRGIGW